MQMCFKQKPKNKNENGYTLLKLGGSAPQIMANYYS
jgi:hypothetical protein